jgi:hypothetical protein
MPDARMTGWRRAAADAIWLVLHSFAIFRRWYHAVPGLPEDGEITPDELRRLGVIEAWESGVDPAERDWGRTGRAEAQIWADRDAASLERLATAAERHLDADESAARLLHHITEGERA